MKIYVEIAEGVNGGIIKWEIPGTDIAIFEWNEDYIHGTHYHALFAHWKNQHDNMHYQIGTVVPEPWQSAYFGGE